ncbi:MAG: 50S ribosomal protein L6 [Sulfuricurvum sp.]|jgi:large subunit ribosomal protein L6
MSRIGKQPISLGSDVKVSANGSVLSFAKGNKSVDLDTKGHVEFSIEDTALTFAPKSNAKQDRAFWGTYRTLADNIIVGLTTGFTKSLEVNGVGFKVAVNGDMLNMSLGFSHDVNFKLPEGVEASVEKNVITLKSHDKQLLGQTAANVRAYRPPEPYKGKGIKYSDEQIVRKAGKTSKK